MRLPKEPFFWALFSSGGMLAALILPAFAAFWWVAVPAGWAPPPEYQAFSTLMGHPLVRLGAWLLIFLFLFHWAHRFRYTLYDGLQLYHLSALIAVVCYGGAAAVTLAAAWALWIL